MTLRSRPCKLYGLVTMLGTLCAWASAADVVPPAAPPKPASWEGAIGLISSYRPEYQGAEKNRLKVNPALFLRYGRLTITNASGFVTRRADDVERGLALDVVQGDHVRMNLALRFDAGRREATSTALAGVGDIKPTVRARLNISSKLAGPWRLGASWNVDALGRGGGNGGDVNAGWEQRISAASVVGVGASLSLAGDRYMQTYYGISAAQAARTGQPVYTPPAGLRDMSMTINLRTNFGPEWTLLAGAGASRLLGPAAASPLTHKRDGWGANVGMAWRF
jgi:outer membrane scaffolding protein for murein synthesis (MipA/OmpV family)